MTWNFATLINATAGTVRPDDPALIHGDHVTPWSAFADRTDSLAAAFQAAGLQPGAKIAHLMRNSPAYLETAVAAFKARLVHVNVNYRYTGEELAYILSNADAEAVVYDQAFAAEVAALRPRLPLLRMFVEVGDTSPVNAFAHAFETLATAGARPAPMAHDADDLIFIYTGGTTGLPKGVMWTHGALWEALGGGAPVRGDPVPDSIASLQENIRAGLGRNRLLVFPPLMHGAGFMMAINTLAMGGTVVTMPGVHFDPHVALDEIARHRPTVAVVVGDAFARPLLNALDERDRSAAIASLQMMVSSGTLWSPDVKAGLLRHNPAMMLLDVFGSSEGLGLGAAVTVGENAAAPTRFIHDGRTRVITDDGRDVAPGSEEVGRIARTGPLPLGYFKDPEKTARTYVELDGCRYVLPGDYAKVDADGSIVLLGRGSQCINTGGEKVYPEEVESALKAHPDVEDALVVGLPDETWGQIVTAAVHARTSIDPEELRAFARQHIAGYKVPKRFAFVAAVPRAPNGKPDYAEARRLILAAAT